MAFFNQHVKVTIFGDMLNGGEIWSTGFRIGTAAEGGGNFGVDTGWVDALKPLWQAVFTGATQNFSPRFRTLGIKAGVVQEDGKMDLDTIYTSTYATPIAGGSSGPTFPPQCAIVVSLRAANPVGLGSKGRMYLPGFNAPIDANGQISGTDTNRLATDMKTFLDAAEVATNSPGYVINASQGRVGVPFAAPVNRRVTSLRVGSVYDTQRRRRNALVESYASQTLVTTP